MHDERDHPLLVRRDGGRTSIPFSPNDGSSMALVRMYMMMNQLPSENQAKLQEQSDGQSASRPRVKRARRARRSPPDSALKSTANA